MGILGGQKTGKCHELSRKSIKFVFYPSHPGGFRGGGVGGQNLKSPVNFMNCQESFKKYPGNAVILCDYYTANILGEAG